MAGAASTSHASLSGLSRSVAFREASLRSEARRAYAIISVVGLMVLVLGARRSVRDLDPLLIIAGGVGMGLLLALQFGVLWLVAWARRHGRMIPMWFIVSSLMVEALIPTAMMYTHISDGALTPFASLVSPPLLAYGIMVSLTTLRLRPWLCLFAGTACAGGHAGLVAYVVHGMGVQQPTTGLPMTAYVNTSFLLLVGGVAAAWVASEMRGHMEAALIEAQARGRMEQDMLVARSIQRALLPRSVPAVPGFEVAGWNRPADQTGGDYYDWHALPDGAWIVSLADVAGHGIGPAMVTAACRAYMRASSAHHGDLGALTSNINRLLADDLPDGRFVTMVSVLIRPGDAAEGKLALLSAGHGPIVLYVGESGSVRDILAQDLPLAIEPGVQYGPGEQVTLGPGDVLALVTDGFVEWARFDSDGTREEFGMERLRESLQRHAHLPAGALIAAITADVTAFAQGEAQQDDLTMVVIRRERG